MIPSTNPILGEENTAALEHPNCLSLSSESAVKHVIIEDDMFKMIPMQMVHAGSLKITQ